MDTFLWALVGDSGVDPQHAREIISSGLGMNWNPPGGAGKTFLGKGMTRPPLLILLPPLPWFWMSGRNGSYVFITSNVAVSMLIGTYNPMFSLMLALLWSLTQRKLPANCSIMFQQVVVMVKKKPTLTFHGFITMPHNILILPFTGNHKKNDALFRAYSYI